MTRALLLRAVTSAALIVFLTLKVFSNELDDGSVTRRDTTMTFVTFVNCDLFNAYVCRSAEKCFYELSAFGNPAFLWAVGLSIIGQLLMVYFPPLQEVFQTDAISFHDMAYIILLSSSVLWLDTLRKKFFAGVFNDGYHASPVSKKEDPAPLRHHHRFQKQSADKNRRRKGGAGWLSLSPSSAKDGQRQTKKDIPRNRSWRSLIRNNATTKESSILAL